MLTEAEHEIYHAYKIVGILTFTSMINSTSDSLKAGKVFNFQHFCILFYEHFLVELSMKKVL